MGSGGAGETARGGKEPPEDGAGATGGASDPPAPKDSQRINLTDPDSAFMRRSRRDGCERACNAQAVVDVGDSRLIWARVSCPSDAKQVSAARAAWTGAWARCRGYWPMGDT